MVEYFQECFWVWVAMVIGLGYGGGVYLRYVWVSSSFWWEITSGDDDFSDLGDW